MTERIELRCCCDAHLIGTLPWTQIGDGIMSATYPRPGCEPLTFEIQPIHCSDRFIHTSVHTPGLKSYTDLWGLQWKYMALKSHEVPLEELRKILGFIERTY